MTDLIDTLSEDARQKAKAKPMPDWIDPMLAKLTHDYFSGPGWIFERKLDGERILAFISNEGDVTLYSRNQKELNDNYLEIQEALIKHAAKGCILDGEIVAFDENEVSDFRKLQQRMHVSSREEALESDVEVYYYLFDLLYVDGHDITGCALRDRKKLLPTAVEVMDPLRLVKYHTDDGIKLFKKACEKGWEGLIAKQAESNYFHSRSNKWLKFKCIKQQAFVIGGYTKPHGERVGFGALLLGFYRDNDLVYAGKVGTGFDDLTLKD
jgi:DNA ligase D-like protein (predicted ligase)